MKILITGSAGFIGYNFANFYYQIQIIKFIQLTILMIIIHKLKNARINDLKKYKNFEFLNLICVMKKNLKKYLK